jgi:integrase
MKLTATKVKAETRPGRHNDGAGLYLLVRPDGRKGWVYRYRLAGRQRDMGLGAHPEVGLAAARQAAKDARDRLRAGADPIAVRAAERAALARRVADAGERTFKAVAERYVARHEVGWKDAKHRAQWRSTLEAYAYPRLGGRDVAGIDRAAVLEVLEPLWARAPETASRLRGRIEAVLDFAAARGWRTAPNPARWRDLRHDLPAPRKLKPVAHQPALPWPRLPAFLAELRARPATAARALEFAVLTAARTGEVLGATWREVDLESATWTVPARRTKAARPHRVALSPAALAVLERVRPLAAKPDDLVFPGQRRGRPLSNMALLVLLRRMQRPTAAKAGSGHVTDGGAEPRWTDTEGRPITPHGFRASFRTWAGDATGFPREVVEAALAHAVRDKVEAAYARGDLLERRRALMAAWAEHAGGGAGAGPDDPAVRGDGGQC